MRGGHMKINNKLIISVFTIVSSLGLLSSCGNNLSSVTSTINPIFQSYKLNVIDEGNWLIYDRDDVYQEEDIIKFHTFVHPINIDMYVDGEFYSSGTRVSINENVDYIEYRYVMPPKEVTVEFKTDLISYSSFLMLYPWLGTSYQDINEIQIEQGFVGTDPQFEPYFNKTITYSSKISSIKDALCDMRICKVRPESSLAETIYGGEYIKYTFVMEKETKTISVANRRMKINGEFYVVYDEYPTE